MVGLSHYRNNRTYACYIMRLMIHAHYCLFVLLLLLQAPIIFSSLSSSIQIQPIFRNKCFVNKWQQQKPKQQLYYGNEINNDINQYRLLFSMSSSVSYSLPKLLLPFLSLRKTTSLLSLSSIHSHYGILRGGGDGDSSNDNDDDNEMISSISSSSNNVDSDRSHDHIQERKKFHINIAGNNPNIDSNKNMRIPKHGIIMMDAFCPYHSHYMIRNIIDKYPNIIVIRVCSNYLTNILLYQESSEDIMDIPMIPNTKEEAIQWKEQLYETIINKLRNDGYIDTNEDIKQILYNEFNIHAVYCESDSGLEDAETLRDLLQVTCLDLPIINEARRNKYIMHQTIMNYMRMKKLNNTKVVTNTMNSSDNDKILSSVDSLYDMNNIKDDDEMNDNTVRIPKQKLCTNVSDAIEFAINQLHLRNNNKVIVKPIRGVASESVYLCSTIEEIHNAYNSITSSAIFGSSKEIYHTSILIQEYIIGTEYAIDVVSCNGTHKIAAIWQYDKRPNNNNNNNNNEIGCFCYYQTKLIDHTNVDNDTIIETLYNAVIITLDALGIKYGFTHNEFIIPSKTIENIVINKSPVPVLIEVNCRQHNMDFTPITMACIGYNALDMTIDALLLKSLQEQESNISDSNDQKKEDEFHDIYPDIPTLRMYGCMVHLVNYKEGILKAIHYIDDIMKLDSVFDLDIYESFREIGTIIHITRDIRTDAGWIQLMNPNSNELNNDYKIIINQYMPHIFEVEEE